MAYDEAVDNMTVLKVNPKKYMVAGTSKCRKMPLWPNAQNADANAPSLCIHSLRKWCPCH